MLTHDYLNATFVISFIALNNVFRCKQKQKHAGSCHKDMFTCPLGLSNFNN